MYGYDVGDVVKFTDPGGAEREYIVESRQENPGSESSGFSLVFVPVPEPSPVPVFVPGYHQWQSSGGRGSALRPPIMWWDQDPNIDEIKNAMPGRYVRVDITNTMNRQGHF